MRLWADVYDASGQRIGPGPVASLLSASVTRALDGAGTVQAEAPGTDERAISLLQNERRWRVWWEAEEGAEAREVGRGIIRGVAAKGSSSAWRLSVDGPDALDELRRRNTLLGRTYPAITFGALITDLAALAGWTASVEAPIRDKVLSARFDGESVLKAIRTLCQQQGVHMRYGGGSLVEVGAFGQSSGVRLVQAEFAPPELYGRDELMLIESLSVDTDSESLCNWIVPVGGGEGESTLSLEYATRSGPYSVRVNYDNGRPVYYLANDASIAKYGRIQKVLAFKSIAPISNSDADLLSAANQLHDAASAYLQRHSAPLSSYSVQAKKGRVTLKPGDKIRLVYKGLVLREDGTPYTYLDIDQDVWIMRVSERVGDGSSVSLELASVDRQPESGVTIVANALESIQVRDLRVQPYPSLATYVYRREIAPGFNADIPIDITNGTLYLNQCRMRVRTRPFRATSKAESASETVTGAGGAVVSTTSSGGSTTQTSTQNANLSFPTSWAKYVHNPYPTLSAYSTNDHFHDAYLIPHDHEISIPDHTHSINIPAHTHTLPPLLVNYGIVDDDETPSGVRMAINGVDVTAQLGGPWAETGGAIETWVDITRYLTNASGGLRQQHRVTISCEGGQGEVEATIELRLTVQSIALGVGDA